MPIAFFLWILSQNAARGLCAADQGIASYTVTRVAGIPQARVEGVSAADALLQLPFSLAQDRLGSLYISEARGITMITASGQTRIITGTSILNTRIPPNTAVLANDPAGEVLMASGAQLLRRFSDGRTAVVAGAIHGGSLGEGISATQADLRCISGIASDRTGNIYVSCQTLGVIRRIAPDGTIRTVAGTFTPGANGDGGPAIRAAVTPTHLATDPAGNLYFADAAANTVRRIGTEGNISTAGGGGSSMAEGVSALLAQLGPIGGIAVDGSGNINVSEPSAHRIRRFPPGGTIVTFIGSSNAPGEAGDQGPIGSARLNAPSGLLTDRDGNLLIADTGNHRIRKTSGGGFLGAISAVAGASHYRGDGARALDALLNSPASVSVDGNGNIYIADSGNFRVRRVGLNGMINTVAGTGIWGTAGDNGPATAAQIRTPGSVAADRQGNYFFTDVDRIRRVTTAGVISTFANGVTPGPLVVDASGSLLAGQLTNVVRFNASGSPTTATNSNSVLVSGLASDGQGNIYIADAGSHVIRKVNANGTVQIIAGTPQRAGFSGDGGPAAAALLTQPIAVAVDFDGNVFIADANGTVIRRIGLDGTIRTVGGRTDFSDQLLAGQALTASFGQVTAMAADTNGQIYFSDSALGTVGKLTLQVASKLTIVSGDNQTGGTEAQLVDKLMVKLTDNDGIPVAGVAVNFYVTAGVAFTASPSAVTGPDGIAAMAVILGAVPGPVRVSASTLGLTPVNFNITTIPRSGTSGPAGTNYSLVTYAGRPYPSDDGLVMRAPESVTVDGDGTIYFSDPSTHRILSRPKDGSVRLYAGSGVRGMGTARDFAFNVRLSNPWGVAAGPNGSLYFADRDNRRICRVTGDKVFEVVLDQGLNQPTAIALDAAAQIYIADGSMIRLLQSDGTLVTVAGNGQAATSPDGSVAAQSSIGNVTGLAVDPNGILYFIEVDQLRHITADGLLMTDVPASITDALPRVSAITFDASGNLYAATQAGVTKQALDGSASFYGIGVLSGVHGLAVEGDGTIWISDTANQVIRRVNPDGTIETIAGQPAQPGDGGLGVLSILDMPAGLAVDASGNLYIADQTARRVRKVTPDGNIQTLAGLTIAATLEAPRYLAADGKGNLYISDGTHIYKLDSGLNLTRVTINSTAPILSIGCLAINPAGELVVCNGNAIQRLTPTGDLTSVAGTGVVGFSGDGGPAVFALLSNPQSAVYDSSGSLYFADRGNLRVRKVEKGLISTIAGTGKRGSSAVEGIAATQADLDDVMAVAVDAASNVYLAETNRIRKVSPSGIIQTIAGSASFGFDADLGSGADAQFDGITSMVIDASGNLYVSDTNNHRVRKLTLVN